MTIKVVVMVTDHDGGGGENNGGGGGGGFIDNIYCDNGWCCGTCESDGGGG